ncbi:MAG: NADH-quinone oxidoreductase subunit NuoE [Candidatus Thermoplasmatota archaeon]
MPGMHENARSSTAFNRSEIDAIAAKYERDKSYLICMLHDIQAKYHYLPEKVLRYLAERLDVSPVQIYRIATFYKAFSLKPKGKHLVRVCLGTACHVRGGLRILETVERSLGVKAGETTPNGKFTLERVNCLGCCALGPVIVVDDEYHGKVTSAKAEKIISSYT